MSIKAFSKIFRVPDMSNDDVGNYIEGRCSYGKYVRRYVNHTVTALGEHRVLVTVVVEE